MAGPGRKFNSETAKAAKALQGKKRSRDQIIADYLDTYLSERAAEGDKRTRQELMVEAAFKAWRKGNAKPMQYLFDRGYGKTKEKIELSGEVDGTNIVVLPAKVADWINKK